MSLDPLLDSLDVALAVLQLSTAVDLVGVEDVGSALVLGLRQHLRPASMGDSSRQIAWKSIRLGSLKVHVVGSGWRVIVEEGVLLRVSLINIYRAEVGSYHVLDFTCIRVHPACSLSGLDVAPDHGGHVSLIIHEASVKVRGFVGIGRLDVSGTSREGILQEVEHGKEFTGGPATLLV